jgi:hypothetical protein
MLFLSFHQIYEEQESFGRESMKNDRFMMNYVITFPGICIAMMITKSWRAVRDLPTSSLAIAAFLITITIACLHSLLTDCLSGIVAHR